MADKGIFIKVLAQLEAASFAAALDKLKTDATKAGADIDRSFQQANATVKSAQSELISAENQLTRAAEARDRAETKAEQSTLARMKAEQNASAEQIAAVQRYVDALEVATAKEAELNSTRMAMRSAEGQQLATLAAQEKALADQRAAAKTEVEASQAGVVAAGATPLANKYNQEADAQAALENRTNSLTDATDASVLAQNRHAQAMNNVTDSTNQANRAFNIIGGGSLLVGAAFLDMGKHAADFQQKMITLQTAGGELHENLQTVSQGILNLSTQTGNSAGQLSDAMLLVEKAGYHGQEGLDVLTSAAQTAKSEHADLTEVVKALTTSLNDYHTAAGNAPDIGSKLVTGANLAKTTLQNLAGSFDTIDPVAMTYGINQDQVLAMLAKVTQTGESPQRAAENLSNMIQHLGTPSNVMREQMGKIGMNADDLAKGIKDPIGLVNQIMTKVNGMSQDDLVQIDKLYKNPELAQALDENASAITSDRGKQILADIRSGKVSPIGFGKGSAMGEIKGSGLDPQQQVLLSNYLASFRKLEGASTNVKKGETLDETRGQILKEITGTQETMRMASILGGTPEDQQKTLEFLKQISGTAREADGSVKGFNEQMQGTGAQLQQAKTALGAAAISMGDAFAPALKVAADGLKGFGDILQHNPILGDVFGGAAIAVGGLFALSKGIQGMKLIVDTLGPAWSRAGQMLDGYVTGPMRRVTSAQTEFKTQADLANASVGTERAAASTTGKEAVVRNDLEEGAAEEELAGKSAATNTAMSGRSRFLGPALGAAIGVPLAEEADNQADKNPTTRDLNHLGGGPGGVQNSIRDWVWRNVWKPPWVHDNPENHALGGIVGYHTGGVLPGYSPGFDNLLGMVNGHPVGLSGGEGILVPEAVKALGPNAINSINSFYSGGRASGPSGYAGGGLLSSMAQGLTNILDGMWGLPAGMDPYGMMSGGYGMSMMPMMMSSASVPTSQGGIKGMAQQLFSRFGWGANEWDSFDKLINSESGWNPNAKNPSSTAYGIGQFLDSTWSGYGPKTSDPTKQLLYTMQYVKNRYGSPSRAWAFHRANNWYSTGGIVGYDGGTANIPGPIPWQDTDSNLGAWMRNPHAMGGDPALWHTGAPIDTEFWKHNPPAFQGTITPPIDLSKVPLVPGFKTSYDQYLEDDFQRRLAAGQVSGNDYYRHIYPDGQQPSAPASSGVATSPGWDMENTGRGTGGASWWGAAAAAAASASPGGSDYSSSSVPNVGMDASPGIGNMPSATDMSSYMPYSSGMMSFGGNAGGVMNFAQMASQLPYVWGGFGPGGFDCTGLAAALANIATTGDWSSGGRFSTANEGEALAARGFQPGPGGLGSLTIGWNGTHSGITLPDGTHIDAEDQKDGIVMGPGSRGATGFPNVMHFDMPGGAPIAGLNFPGMASPSLSGGMGMPGMAGDMPGGSAMQNAGQGGFTLPNIARLMGTFLAELALGNPAGALATGRPYLGMPTTNVPMPGSPEFTQNIQQSTDALSDMNGIQRQQALETDKSAIAWDNVQKAQNKIFKDQTTKNGAKNLANDYLGLNDAAIRYRDTLIRNDQADDKAALKAGADQRKSGLLDSRLATANDELQQLVNSGASADKIAAKKNQISGLQNQQTTLNLNMGQQGYQPFGNQPIGYTGGLGSPFGGPGMVSPASFGGPGGMTPGGMQPGGWFGSQQPAGNQSRQFGMDNKSPGFGTSLASNAMSAIGGAMTGGIAGGMPGGQQIAQLADRTAGYIGQLAGIGAEGLLETFSLNDSPLSDPSKSLPGKIIAGIAGAHPSGPNMAGVTQPPLKPQDDKNKQNQGQDGQQPPGINIENQNFYGQQDSGQVNREQNRNMMQYWNGSPT